MIKCNLTFFSDSLDWIKPFLSQTHFEMKYNRCESLINQQSN